ncbi:MAG: magnesium transporter CorA family protein [Anaerolineaceae bacterium]
MTEINFYVITTAGSFIQKDSVKEARYSVRKGGFIWLDYLKPTKNDLLPLIDLLGLHPLSVEDCLDDEQIPKIEDYPKHSFILFNSIEYQKNILSVSEVDLFIGEKFLVTVSRHGLKDHSLIQELRRYVEMDIESSRQGPAFLAHVLLDHIVDKKFIAIEALEENINATEDIILEDIDNFKPAQLLNLRRDLMALRKTLFHEREILIKICRNDCRFIGLKAILLYRDIYDHLAKFFELTETDRDIVTSLMDMYLSMLNNQMAKAANQTNATVRRLTFITTIFMPLSLLAGIGGMSEWSMMTGPGNWRIAYPLFLLAMVIIGVLNYFLIKWLEKRGKV